jgi:tetratricopeptide (TPR) repeat protein
MKKRTVFAAALALAVCGHLSGQAGAQLAYSGWLFTGLSGSITTDYDTAIACYTEAIKLDPNNDTYYNNRGFLYNAKGDYDKAIADLTRAIQIDPNSPNAYRHRGVAYMRKKDYQKARADLDKALQLKPDYADAKTAREELRKLGY